MSQKQIQMPSSGGGLVRYFDEFKSKFQIKPMHVIVVIGIIILVELYLYKATV